jgi:hypothetical protein
MPVSQAPEATFAVCKKCNLCLSNRGGPVCICIVGPGPIEVQPIGRAPTGPSCGEADEVWNINKRVEADEAWEISQYIYSDPWPKKVLTFITR